MILFADSEGPDQIADADDLGVPLMSEETRSYMAWPYISCINAL